MKCKGKLKKFAAAAVVSALILCCTQSAFASYNDERFEIYVNMNNKVTTDYVIPNLYRQDSAYAYYKSFPVVVTGGIEYVPISAFSLFSYISVTYSKTSDNFYMTNTKSKKYLSFDVVQHIAESNDGTITELETKIFYRTRYIPARKVAELLGTIICESYDDTQKGVYAFRIRDNAASLSFTAMLDRYLPAFYKKQEPEPPKNDPEPPTPEKDPVASIASRKMHFIFTDFIADNARGVLNSCNAFSQTASFCMNKDDIYNNPEFVRSALVSGNSVILTADTESLETNDISLTAEQFCKELERANDALYDASKQKVRLCYVPDALTDALSEENNKAHTQNELYSLIRQRGYMPIKFNTSSPQSFSNSYSVFNRVQNIMVSDYPANSEKTCIVQLETTQNSGYFTALIFEFMAKYPQFTTQKTTLALFD